MKKSFYFAAVLLGLASCTSEDFTGDQGLKGANENAAISFGLDVPTATRATGASAATLLGNQFIVYGEKGETADGAAPVTDGSTGHQLVFKNYVVNYVASTANTTTSNTKDWEYVGLTQGYGTNVTPQANETQTIKYWDYAASNYVFTAFSALQSDLSSGKVTVTKIQAKTDGNKVFDKGYTVTLSADADATKLYFSDRQVINQGIGSDRNSSNNYGGYVNFTFRNGISQVRAAMYETISGYQVEIDKFYYADASNPAFTAMTTAGTDKFYANVPNLTTDKAATLTVTYHNEGALLNQPKISVSGTANNYIALGTNLKDGTTLGETVATAVYDQSTKAYTTVFPQEANATNLKLKVDYTLKNPTTGETINVKGATAEVPAQYLQWKPNFKYTYIFKVSDNSNGHTGPGTDPAGLYPITFDAAVIEAEDGQAEYITTVSEPSITTFGVKSNKYFHDGAEYEKGCDIYTTFMEGSTVITPTSTPTPNYKVYSVTTSDATNFPITEASVAEALGESPTGTAIITCTAYTTNVSEVTKVPSEDGVELTINAVKMGNVAPGTYAIEYTASAAWTGTYDKVYKVIKVTAAP